SSQPLDKSPPWGQAEAAELLAPLLLAGAWQDGCVADQAVVAKMAGIDYASARRVVNRWRSEPDAPVRYADGAWEFISPIDAWTFLHSFLSPEQLEIWGKTTASVLTENDPRFELPPDERWRASVHGKRLSHSYEIRMGLSRTLALLATRDGTDLVADTVSLQARESQVVRNALPPDASWQRWASLGDTLPLLAEAAPDVVLEAAEAGVRG